MRGMEGRFGIGRVGLFIAILCVAFAPAFGQSENRAPHPQSKDDTCTGYGECGKIPKNIVGDFQNVHALPPGGPAPRMSDGHIDLTGRYYPDAAGRMLQVAYPLDPGSFLQFDPEKTPELAPKFKAGIDPKYRKSVGYGDCDQAGTPSTVLEQASQHAPMELIATPQRLVMLFEYPLDVRMVYFNRQHPKDPDPTFNGDTTAHWEGDTLVLDVIAVDERMRNFGGGGYGGWFPSDKEHITERITRTSKNYLTYQITIEDPVVLAQPWKSAPRTWTLAADPHDEWGEVFCTLNEEPSEYNKIKEHEAQEKGK
jgi:hypothetical protein